MKRLVIILTSVYALNILAQWSSDPSVNNPICTIINDQYYPQMISDGKGGAIIIWIDERSGILYNFDIYAQRIDSNGTIRWPLEGVVVCERTAAGYVRPRITSDMNGGCIIVWQDFRNGEDYDLYAQRIDSTGTVQWITNGVAICVEDNNQKHQTITSDNKGGAIVTWEDSRILTNSDIYVQHINSEGMIQWALNGILVCNYEHSQGSPKVVSDINGGVIIVWEDSRSESFSDIYAQSINSNGLVKWNANGVPICTSTQTQKNTQIISNNSGSAIITWEDFRNGIQEIFTQKIDSSGVVQWKINGESVCRYPARGYSPAIVGYNHGGAIICWNDYRNGLNSDIYAQEINADGVVEWTTNGIPICTTPFEQSDSQLVEDESGGAIITWGDGGDQGSIYAQRVNQDGVIQWKLDGVPICTATGDQAFAQIVSDGKAGAIITWQDHRFGNWDIYTSKIDCAGNLGNPTLLENEISIQKNYLLAQNYPNPFNPSTKINYQIGNESLVQLKVYDVLGNEVARLVDEYKVSGSYEIEFNASQLSSGIYFYKLRAGGFVETKKMILLR